MVIKIVAKYCDTCRHYKTCGQHLDEACNDYESREVLYQAIEKRAESNDTEKDANGGEQHG